MKASYLVNPILSMHSLECDCLFNWKTAKQKWRQEKWKSNACISNLKAFLKDRTGAKTWVKSIYAHCSCGRRE